MRMIKDGTFVRSKSTMERNDLVANNVSKTTFDMPSTPAYSAQPMPRTRYLPPVLRQPCVNRFERLSVMVWEHR